MRKLSRIGFFKELPYGDADGESLKDSVARLSSENVDRITSYLKSGIACIVAPGISRDFLSTEHEIIGSLALCTDGKFLWPTDLAYYVEKYHVGLSKEFIEHMEMNSWLVPAVDITSIANERPLG